MDQRKPVIDHRIKLAQNILIEQIDTTPDELFNEDQKEYVKGFIQLPARMKEIIVETMLENHRRGNFVRIYPTKSSDYYDCFLS